MRPVLFLLGLGVLSGCNCGSMRQSDILQRMERHRDKNNARFRSWLLRGAWRKKHSVEAEGVEVAPLPARRDARGIAWARKHSGLGHRTSFLINPKLE